MTAPEPATPEAPDHGTPPSGYTLELLVEFFDAIMTTFRWRQP